MQDINERLDSLDEDGKQYAHFFSHPDHPGYYGVWVRERTPEYVSVWLPESPMAGYKLELSIEMHDDTFCDYMAEMFPEQKSVHFLKTLYCMGSLNPETVNTWANISFKQWRQEKIRINRVKWLSQYPWVTKDRMQEREVENNN
jgi:hypothetical protein